MSKRTAAKTSRRKSRAGLGENVYQGVEELANLCERVVVMHTTGVNTPPARHPRGCQNKYKKNPTVPKLISHSNDKNKTTFGKGKIGVSCESYGIKNCICCRPDTAFPQLPVSVFNFDDFSNYITSDDDDVIIVDSFPNRAPLSITIDDESSTSIEVPDLNVLNVGFLHRDQNNSSPPFQNVPKAGVDQQEMLDYVNLVTNDLDESNLKMREYELQFMNSIQADMELEINKPIESVQIGNENNGQIQTASSSRENISSTSLSSMNPPVRVDAYPCIRPTLTKKQNISNLTEIIDSPAKETANSGRIGLDCPICLDSLKDKEIMSTICGHLFCTPCITNSIKRNKHCPNCRKKLTLKSIHPIFI